MSKDLKNAAVGLAGFAMVLAVLGFALAATIDEVPDLSKWQGPMELISGGSAALIRPGDSISVQVEDAPLKFYTFSINAEPVIRYQGDLQPAGSFDELDLRVYLTMAPGGQAGPNVFSVTGESENPVLEVRVEGGADITRNLPVGSEIFVRVSNPHLSGKDLDKPTPTPTFITSDKTATPPPVPSTTMTPTESPTVTPTPTGTVQPVVTPSPQPQDTPASTPPPLEDVAISLSLAVRPQRVVVNEALSVGTGLGNTPGAEVLAVARNNQGKIDTHGTMTVTLSQQDAGFGQLIDLTGTPAAGTPQYVGFYAPPTGVMFRTRTVHIEAVYEVPGQDALRADATVRVERIASLRERENLLTYTQPSRNIFMQVRTR